MEGAWNEDGKGQSIYDFLTHTLPSLFHNSTGDVACDSYHKYKEDVKILKNYGAKAYRFSIAWSRVLPNGTTDHVNQVNIFSISAGLKNSTGPILCFFGPPFFPRKEIAKCGLSKYRAQCSPRYGRAQSLAKSCSKISSVR